MKAVILAGGYGTRISEETTLRPKPMIEIGGKPILWHIMKIYSAYGINEFIICLGYKGYVIKEYFANYFLHMSNVTIDFSDNNMKVHENKCDPWKVSLIDTGLDTMTGGRIKRIQPFIGNEDFCLTYGDGVADINIKELISKHKQEKRYASVTAVQRPGRFGSISFKDNNVKSFTEKPIGDGGWINGGFFVLSPKIFSYIKDDQSIWEKEPMENLAKDNQMSAYFHKGYWQAMDTLREKQTLETLWQSGKAPWKIY